MAGVLLAASQLVAMQKQTRTAFEDSLTEQYREIIHRLPVNALLGEQISDQEFEEALRTFYRYFDLCNEQVFLHKKGRIRRQTWAEWKEGIEQNLMQPAFEKAWAEIARRAPKSFDGLRETSSPRLPSSDGIR